MNIGTIHLEKEGKWYMCVPDVGKPWSEWWWRLEGKERNGCVWKVVMGWWISFKFNNDTKNWAKDMSLVNWSSYMQLVWSWCIFLYPFASVFGVPHNAVSIDWCQHDCNILLDYYFFFSTKVRWFMVLLCRCWGCCSLHHQVWGSSKLSGIHWC